MNAWSLPTTAEIGGRTYDINADFRDVLEIIEILNDPDEGEYTKRYVALSLFYDNFEDMPQECFVEAFVWMSKFISMGEEDDGRPSPKTIDWEQDRSIIAAEINKVAGMEVRALEFCHWWTFLGYFAGIGEGQLSFIVSIREKLRKHKKLEKHEREFYRNNRAKVDFNVKRTEKEQAALNKWFSK